MPRTTITQQSVITPELAAAGDYIQTLDTTQLATVDLAPGEPVAPESVSLQGMSLNGAIAAEIETFRPQGFKYPTISALGREWSEWSLEGVPTYNELAYPLMGIIALPVVADVGVVGSAYGWTFTPATNTADEIVTYTFEQGSTSNRIHRAQYGTFTDLSFSIDRSSFSVSGSAIAQSMIDGEAGDGTGAAVTSFIDTSGTIDTRSLVPILPSQTCVYQNNNTPGSVEDDLLTRVLSVEINVSNRFAPLWVLDCSQSSWVIPIEVEPEVTMSITMEADNKDTEDLSAATGGEIEGGDIGMAFLHAMRANGNLTDTDHADYSRPNFFRVEATGDVLEAGFPYLFRFDMAGRVTDVSEFTDEDGLFAITWTFAATHDATYGKAYEFYLQNNFNQLASS